MKNIICLLITCTICCNCLLAQINAASTMNAQTKNTIIDNLCKLLNKNYVFPDKAKLISDYLYEKSRKGKYETINDPNELANQLLRDIRSVNKDDHLRIEYDPSLEKNVLTFLSSKAGANKVAAEDLLRDEKNNFHFKKIEILPSNIGYITLNGFANPSQAASKTIYAAMQFVAHTDALIIDLRNNFGGNGAVASEIASYFFPTKTYTGRNFNRIEDKWINQYIENNKALTHGLVLKMPVYILTSKRTFSAAEGLAYTLQSLKNFIIIGDTTRGGAHLTRSFSIGNGFVGFIPYLRGENAVTKTDWEGTGVIPNIYTEESNSLVTAQHTILHEQIAKATNQTEKRKIQYIINYNKSKYSSVTINPLEASKFTGRFAEFEVSVQGGELVFRDTNHRTIYYKKMIAITPTLFQVGNDYQVEFLIENGMCNAVNMFWDDGYTDKIDRSDKR
jgi:hypothetical protein